MSDPWMLWLADMRFSMRTPQAFSVMKNVLDYDLDESLRELREKHPDEYALLTEHILLPEDSS